MKTSKVTDAQKAFIVKQDIEGTTVAEICRKAGISPAPYLNWKKKYEGLMSSETRLIKSAETCNPYPGILRPRCLRDNAYAADIAGG